jgi:heme oxygenase (mycobilin-producing)
MEHEGRARTSIDFTNPIMQRPGMSLGAGMEERDTDAHTASPVIVISRFVVVNGMSDDVKEAFRHRPHLVDDAPGFIGMEVISPQDTPEEIWLMTWWASAEHYRTWHRGHMYRESHAGIPKGLRLDPRSTEIRVFDHVCS